VREGYIQRSGVPPAFHQPKKFLKWLAKQSFELVATNN
jgi:hypothetical protein